MTMATEQEADHPMEPAVPLPNGLAGAAILSAGAGCFALGVLAVAGDASKSMAHWLTLYKPTGPLSGVSSTAILLWLALWLILGRRWRSKTIAIARVNALAFVLLLAGVLLAFPPFEDLLLRK
ncbi:MAG: hypothetical protein ACYCSN_13010 [Acidobacteriaceae bacterium]